MIRHNASIVSRQNVQGGQAVIDGTRIQAAVIFGYYRGGETIPQIAALYNLTHEQVRNAIQFCKQRRKQKKNIWY